jgi:hypothetical protein
MWRRRVFQPARLVKLLTASRARTKTLVAASVLVLASAAAASPDSAGKRLIARSKAEEFPHQAGGHGGILRIPQSGSILKPVMPGPKGQMERNFYVEAQRDAKIQPFIPEFQGFVWVKNEDGQDEPEGLSLVCQLKLGSCWPPASSEYIQLADATKDFRLPCISVYSCVLSAFVHGCCVPRSRPQNGPRHI